MLALLLAGAAAGVAYGASGSGGHGGARNGGGEAPLAAGGVRVVSEVNLSHSDQYDTITILDGRLTLSGHTPGARDAAICHSAVVNPITLVLSRRRSGSCDNPMLSGVPVLPIEAGEPRVAFRGAGTGIGTDTVRIAHVTVAPPGYRVGAVVMRSPQISDEHPSWAYGDGYLWLYDGASSQGSEVLSISLTSGAVLARVSMPNIPRPILAADSDGLWMAPAVNSAGLAVYHLAPHATTATAAVRLNRQYVSWMVADGHDVWLDLAFGGTTQTLLRLHGDSAIPALRVTLRASTLDDEVQTQGGGAAVVGTATDGLWAAVPPLQGNTQRIVRIDPNTGTPHRVAIITPGYAAPNSVAYGSHAAIAYDHSMFLLDPPQGGGFSALYRIT